MTDTYTRENVGTFRVRVESGFYSADELRAMAKLADEQREKIRESLAGSITDKATGDT